MDDNGFIEFRMFMIGLLLVWAGASMLIFSENSLWKKIIGYSLIALPASKLLIFFILN